MGIKSQGHPTSKYNAVWQNTAKGAVGPKPPPPAGMDASGGYVSEYKVGSDIYRAHIFSSPGTFTVTATSTSPSLPSAIEYLVIGGGGAGGVQGGAGGAGGYRSSVTGESTGGGGSL